MSPSLVTLNAPEASIVLEHDPDRGVLWRHCGTRVRPGDLPSLAECRGPASFAPDDDLSTALAPAAGMGWFGPATVELRASSGAAKLFAPTRFEVEEADDRIEVRSFDDVSSICHALTIRVIDGGAFGFSARITSFGEDPVVLASLASIQVPLNASSDSIVSWRGRHNAELKECREAMPEHRWERVTRRGISGHGGPPGAYVLDTDTGWHRGLVHAVQLAWSGDSEIAVERDDEGFWHLSAQATLAPGELVLSKGATFTAPEAFLAISTRGRNGAMAQQHAAVRSLTQWPGGAMKPRPVHLNSWEACYFAHDANRIARLAQAGADIGIERFVLDDGWFKGRRHDRAGLGDWETDPETYPDGLGPLASQVRKMGMEFGLWVEPEMINTDSDLYRAHPEWALAADGRKRPTARNQLVLDMRREDVRDHLFAQLDAILSETPISYLKWDHNRDHAPSGGAGQTRGSYDLFGRLRSAHPDVEIEGCAGGGGRSDAGLAPFVHRFWTSDNIDAVARVGMQRGFLAFLPPELMGSHVGASPAHATGRSQAMGFRAAIACMGHLGVELDPEALAEGDRMELARWIGFYKQWRHLLHRTRVDLGQGTDDLLWQARGTAREKLLFCVRTSPPQDRRPQPLRLPFASLGEAWKVRLLDIGEQAGHGMTRADLFTRMGKEAVEFSGSWLAESGLPMPLQKAESVAIFHLEEAA
ncbi:alpha-galactosidase [Qipengyuania xiapuensis]|uniref:Alpha-galactosidase n=1 Tax=Qipengyuania xiapuensis TaxID=2867236 RepID=A0ABX8ZWC3_9SPHN|nr:alpha-galactosidase [Qipengyuania xiapuensis]